MAAAWAALPAAAAALAAAWVSLSCAAASLALAFVSLAAAASWLAFAWLAEVRNRAFKPSISACNCSAAVGSTWPSSPTVSGSLLSKTFSRIAAVVTARSVCPLVSRATPRTVTVARPSYFRALAGMGTS